MEENDYTSSELISRLKERYGDEAITAKAQALKREMESYLESINFKDTTYISKRLLVYSVIDYFADIWRLENFHSIPYASDIKIVAYTVYWICRRKPIQITADKSKKAFSYPNEGFAVTYFCREIEKITGKYPTTDLMKTLYYYFRFRLLDAQAFEQMVYHYISGTKITA